MKKILLFICLTLSSFSWAQNASWKMPNLCLQSGEVVDYYAYFQLGLLHINGMKAHITLEADTFQNQEVFSILAICETERTMEAFFDMVDSFWVQLRQEDLLPLYYYEHDFEKKLEIHRAYAFSYTDSTTTVDSKAFVPCACKEGVFSFQDECPLDAMSLLYRLRNYDFSNTPQGKRFPFDFFDKGESVPLYIEYVGKDTVTLSNDSSYACLRFIFNTVEGTLFSKKHPVQLWLSDDQNRIPIFGEAKLKIGYAKVEFQAIKNNKYPLTPVVLKEDKKRRP